jgi:hypothetical protein
MSTQYVCELYYETAKIDWRQLMKMSVANLGFLPNVMTMYLEDSMLEEIAYNENILFSLPLSSDIPEIIVRHRLYNELSDNPWFKFGPSEGNFVSLRWSNNNLNFLISESISKFLTLEGFTAGYAFNYNDAWEQNAKASERDIVDFALFPGQFKYTCGMQFMAAPLMWFGKPFFQIVNKETLLNFTGADDDSSESRDVVCIELFDLYDNPAYDQNRERQRHFSSFVGLDDAVTHFEEKNFVDAAEALKFFLSKE